MQIKMLINFSYSSQREVEISLFKGASKHISQIVIIIFIHPEIVILASPRRSSTRQLSSLFNTQSTTIVADRPSQPIVSLQPSSSVYNHRRQSTTIIVSLRQSSSVYDNHRQSSTTIIVSLQQQSSSVYNNNNHRQQQYFSCVFSFNNTLCRRSKKIEIRI